MMQQNVRCLIQGCADHLVTATTDAAVIVSLTRTVAFRGEAEMRSNIARFREALGRIDPRPIGEGHNHADTGNGHQPAADGIPPRQLLAESIEPFDSSRSAWRTRNIGSVTTSRMGSSATSSNTLASNPRRATTPTRRPKTFRDPRTEFSMSKALVKSC